MNWATGPAVLGASLELVKYSLRGSLTYCDPPYSDNLFPQYPRSIDSLFNLNKVMWEESLTRNLPVLTKLWWLYFILAFLFPSSPALSIFSSLVGCVDFLIFPGNSKVKYDPFWVIVLNLWDLLLSQSILNNKV